MHVEQLLKLFWLLCVMVVGPWWLCTLHQYAVSMRPEPTHPSGSEGSQAGSKLSLTTSTTHPTGLSQGCLLPL